MIGVDRKSGILRVKSGSVITNNIRFDGIVVAGIDCSFLGSIEAKEVRLGKGCTVAGLINAEEVTVGAYVEFNEIIAENVVVMVGCRGKRILARDVRISRGCKIDEVKAEKNLLIEGNSKIGKMEARKITAKVF